MAIYDSVAFRYIAAGSHPNHNTLTTLRRRFIDELCDLFVQALELAKQMKFLKMGTVRPDGTKIAANASHRATGTSSNSKLNSIWKSWNCWHRQKKLIRPTLLMA